MDICDPCELVRTLASLLLYHYAIIIKSIRKAAMIREYLMPCDFTPTQSIKIHYTKPMQTFKYCTGQRLVKSQSVI